MRAGDLGCLNLRPLRHGQEVVVTLGLKSASFVDNLMGRGLPVSEEAQHETLCEANRKNAALQAQVAYHSLSSIPPILRSLHHGTLEQTQ